MNGAPLLVQYWMPREKEDPAALVGPPWIFTSSGGCSSAGSSKSCAHTHSAHYRNVARKRQTSAVRERLSASGAYNDTLR